MKAITLHPEWAWAICRLGKNVENRTWKPPQSFAIGSRVAIHAGVAFGGAGPFTNINRVFDPVATMARRAGWRLGIEKAENSVIGFHTKRDDTFKAKVHQMPRGAVVAVATFAGILSPARRSWMKEEDWPWWAVDQFGWVLTDVVVLDKAVECRGMQRLWTLGEDVARVVGERATASGRKVGEPQESSRGCGHK
jgi:hypothetical protein